MSGELFKSFSLAPQLVVDANGEVIDNPTELLGRLAQQMDDIARLTEWELFQGTKLREDIGALLDDPATAGLKNAKIGERLKVKLPPDMRQKGTGQSRLEWLFRDRVVGEARSWLERTRAAQGTSTKFVSKGWKRTANATIPWDLASKLNLGVVDQQFAYFGHNPLADGIIELHMVIAQQWYVLEFVRPKRFKNADRITLPVVRLDDKGTVVFDFTAVHSYNYTRFSSRYIVAVDVGIENYATVGVWDVQENRLAYTTTLSQRVHSLVNSIKASEVQRTVLKKRGDNKDAALHRRAASRKKQELAIIAAQEIAHIAHEWDNAVVVFEDLSWIRNTMQNGRWNRGELVKRSTEFVELNGSRVIKVNAANTSQECHKCHKQVIFDGWHIVICDNCHTRMDRDENACGNIAQRAVNTVTKMIQTRSQSKKVINKKIKRTPDTKPTLKYPHRKTQPTPKQPKPKKQTHKHIEKQEVFHMPASMTGTVHVVVNEKNPSDETVTGNTNFLAEHLQL